MIKKIIYFLYNFVFLIILLFILFNIDFNLNDLFLPRFLRVPVFNPVLIFLALFLKFLITLIQGEFFTLVLYKINKWYLKGFYQKTPNESKLFSITILTMIFITVAFDLFLHILPLF